MKEVYILLFWFWEGDGYLVNSYLDCFLTLEEALKIADQYGIAHNQKYKIYLTGEKLPDEDSGGYHSVGFLQIINRIFDET